MISRDQAYRILRAQGYEVDETFQPEGVTTFCLGWKNLSDRATRTVMSDGSVYESLAWLTGTGMVDSFFKKYAPGEEFPEVTRGK